MRRDTPFHTLVFALLVLPTLGAVPAFAGDNPVRVRSQSPPASPQYCGIDSLFVGLRLMGNRAATVRQLEEDLPVGANGVSVEAIAAAAEKNGVTATVVRADVNQIARWGNYAILHVQGGHFVTFLGIENGRIILFDNSVGVIDCTQEWFEKHYAGDGTAILLGPPPPEIVLRRHWVKIGVVGSLVLCGLALSARRRRNSSPTRTKTLNAMESHP